MFAPGDEVVKVRQIGHVLGVAEMTQWSLPIGTRAVVELVIPHVSGIPGLRLAGFADRGNGHCSANWVKVQKRKDTRNLTEWLSQPSGYDEEQHSPAPKAPAKKRERLS